MSQKQPDTKPSADEQALDEQSLEQVSGGVSRARGAAGESVAVSSTRRRVSGGDDDLDDLEVER